MSFKAFGIFAAMMATFAAGVVTPALAQTPQPAGLRCSGVSPSSSSGGASSSSGG
jgi:hypothetical protein